jgi:hypothetical protein
MTMERGLLKYFETTSEYSARKTSKIYATSNSKIEDKSRQLHERSPDFLSMF